MGRKPKEHNVEKELEKLELIEVQELDDPAIEDAAGGAPITNFACPGPTRPNSSCVPTENL